MTITISEIRRRTQETSPYYFTRKTLSFFGQTMRDFKVYKQSDGRYKISAPMRDKRTGNIIGKSERFFNPITNELQHS